MQNKKLILVSYKNKVLLSTSDLLNKNRIWSFLEEENGKFRTKSATFQLIEKKMNTGPVAISKELLSDDEYIYQVKLTDKNVNSIQRLQGIRLEFYSLEEMGKLQLTNNTRMLIENYKYIIQNLILD